MRPVGFRTAVKTAAGSDALPDLEWAGDRLKGNVCDDTSCYGGPRCETSAHSIRVNDQEECVLWCMYMSVSENIIALALLILSEQIQLCAHAHCTCSVEQTQLVAICSSRLLAKANLILLSTGRADYGAAAAL